MDRWVVHLRESERGGKRIGLRIISARCRTRFADTGLWSNYTPDALPKAVVDFLTVVRVSGSTYIVNPELKTFIDLIRVWRGFVRIERKLRDVYIRFDLPGEKLNEAIPNYRQSVAMKQTDTVSRVSRTFRTALFSYCDTLSWYAASQALKSGFPFDIEFGFLFDKGWCTAATLKSISPTTNCRGFCITTAKATFSQVNRDSGRITLCMFLKHLKRITDDIKD